MLIFDRVTFGYSRKKIILRDFSLTVADGERVSLSGKSGSGKTTVLRLAMGLITPKSGFVRVPGTLRCSAVFQEDRLIPWKTILENTVLFADETPGTTRKEESMRILSMLGIADSADSYPAELSGGMKRRAALARALVRKSDLLILDEAFTGLDDATREACLQCTDREARGRMILMATHDLAEAEFLGARVVPLA